MSYEIIFSDLSLKQLKKLEKPLQERIVTVIERCRIRPQDHVKKLVGNPYYRLRVGDYRVVMDIRKGELRILVLEIGHRRNIYE